MKCSLPLRMLALLALLGACDDAFLERPPQGVLSEPVLANAAGIDRLLVSAYSMLDGWAGWENGAPWHSSGTNWLYGDVSSDDAYRGSDAGDSDPGIAVERYATLPPNTAVYAKWGAVYEGIARCNDVLRVLAQVPPGVMPEEAIRTAQAEARFLRGHFHFEAKKMWNSPPYISETGQDVLMRVPNTRDIWPDIEADFQYAYDHLPAEQAQRGRVTRFAAAACLAKAHLFQSDFEAAVPLLDAVIQSGRFRLADCYHDNFNVETQYNSPEILFAIQFSVNDGAPEGANGNYGSVLNYPYAGGPGQCCGFFQPSQNLVNAFQTDSAGLPLLDSFNDTDVASDEGLLSSDPFTEHSGPLDPRLDWTVGRRGIPYLDWGDHPGHSWIRDQRYGGPYSPKKQVYYRAQEGAYAQNSGTWTKSLNANDYALIRYADVLLLRAEAAVELFDLETARALVNQVRARALSGCYVRDSSGSPAASYRAGLYTQPWTSATYARKAVRTERRLELAMEGHRFFDLVRWGVAEPVLNAYLAKEKQRRHYLSGVVFRLGQDEYYPIPQQEINLSYVNGRPVLIQNPGY